MVGAQSASRISALFLVLEEVGFAGNVRDAKAMKNKTTGSRAITNEKYQKVRTDRVRYYNTQEHVNNNSSDHARYTEADDRRVVILETGSAYAGAPSKEAYDTIWAPLYDQKVTLAFAKLLYCEIDITAFVPAVEMLAVHTAEKDYQIVQSLRFPFNALYDRVVWHTREPPNTAIIAPHDSSPTKQCPLCKTVFTPKYKTHAEAQAAEPGSIYVEQHMSGFCSDSCWKALMPDDY